MSTGDETADHEGKVWDVDIQAWVDPPPPNFEALLMADSSSGPDDKKTGDKDEDEAKTKPRPSGRAPAGKMWDGEGWVDDPNATAAAKKSPATAGKKASSKAASKSQTEASSTVTFVGRKVVKVFDGETFRGEVTEEVRNVTTVYDQPWRPRCCRCKVHHRTHHRTHHHRHDPRSRTHRRMGFTMLYTMMVMRKMSIRPS